MNPAARILLIEDSPTLRELVLQILEIENYAVAVAEDGEIGLRLARETLPDLVLCDIAMPKMNGHELLRTLRADPATARLPFIFITAKAERSDLRTGMDLGADDYLTKPFGADELLSAVQTRLARQGKFSGAGVQPESPGGESWLQLSPAFRTPLAGILGLAELLGEAEFSREERTSMMAELRASARRLERNAINVILHLELELARYSPERALRFISREAASLGEWVRSVASSKSREYGREFQIEIESGNDRVSLDAVTVRKILDELLDNACHASPPASRIKLTLRSEPKSRALIIQDEGAGMDDQKIQRVLAYEPSDHAQRQQQGLGLGLVIVRGLIELNGGKLSLESNPPSGLRVNVTLPSAPAAS